jgi:hypothetical protein
VVYCGGAILAGVVIGILCDLISIRKMGYVVIILTALTLAFLYLAIFIKYFYTTLLLYLFVGMSTASLYTWLLCACSKIYSGRF